MPHGHKTPGIIVAEIRLTKAAGDCTVLIVEGAGDVRFWTSRKDRDCELVDGEGKPNVKKGILSLDEIGVGGVLGLIDEDYDYLMGERLESENLVCITPHDLECLLLCFTAFDSVLAEFGDSEKIYRFVEKENVDVRSALLERALVFGRVRWAAQRSGIAIPDGAINVHRFVDISTWTVNGDQLIDVIASGGGSELRQQLDQLPSVHSWRIVRGHDVLAILRVGFRRVLGNLKSSVGGRDIARVLRSGIDAVELQATELWRDIQNWESVNPPHHVLSSTEVPSIEV